MTKTIDHIIAQALVDSDMTIVTSVPGTGCCSIFEAYHELVGQKPVYSFHEEVAYTIAHGASLAGHRAATIVKAHGFAKAMNSIIDSLSAGTTAGFCVLVCDDPTGRHSDNILQSEKLLMGTEIPYRIPDIKNIYNEIMDAIKQSENLHLPVALILNSDEFNQKTTFEQHAISRLHRVFDKNVNQHVLCPLTGRFQRKILEQKLSGKKWEHLNTLQAPLTFDSLPDSYRLPLQQYITFFDIFKNFRGSLVTGETGLSSLFAFPPFSCIDIVTYMGGSIPLAVGAFLAGVQDVWAVTGDFSFIAAGHLGLFEALQRKIPLKVIICDNGKAEATGGQIVVDYAIPHILTGYRKSVLVIKNPQDKNEIQDVLDRVKKSHEIQIIVVDFKENSKIE